MGKQYNDNSEYLDVLFRVFNEKAIFE